MVRLGSKEPKTPHPFCSPFPEDPFLQVIQGACKPPMPIGPTSPTYLPSGHSPVVRKAGGMCPAVDVFALIPVLNCMVGCPPYCISIQVCGGDILGLWGWLAWARLGLLGHFFPEVGGVGGPKIGFWGPHVSILPPRSKCWWDLCCPVGSRGRGGGGRQW